MSRSTPLSARRRATLEWTRRVMLQPRGGGQAPPHAKLLESKGPSVCRTLVTPSGCRHRFRLIHSARAKVDVRSDRSREHLPPDFQADLHVNLGLGAAFWEDGNAEATATIRCAPEQTEADGSVPFG